MDATGSDPGGHERLTHGSGQRHTTAVAVDAAVDGLDALPRVIAPAREHIDAAEQAGLGDLGAAARGEVDATAGVGIGRAYRRPLDVP